MSKKNLLLMYNVERQGGEIAPGQEGEPYPDRNPGHTEFTPLGLIYSNREMDFNSQYIDKEEIDFKLDDSIIGKTVNLVIVRYTTGDTFGYSTGEWQVVLASMNDKKVEKLEAQIRDGSYKGYAPWNGYFESLEDVEIYSFVVQG